LVDVWDCAPITDYYSYAHRKWSTTDSMNINITYDKCSNCTLSAAIQNYFADFSIYPNPAGDKLIISNSSKLDQLQMITIFGSIVINQEIKPTTGKIDLCAVNPNIFQ
tara:strand:+ start:1799 stop:2122 length:324 start_codon:yes stop_codon:yes gene_type:complete